MPARSRRNNLRTVPRRRRIHRGLLLRVGDWMQPAQSSTTGLRRTYGTIGLMFRKRKPTPEPEPVHIHHIHQTQEPHTELTTDGWQHATIYHHMIRQAQQARWTMIMPDLTTIEDGEQIPLMMSQPIVTCPLAVHPAPVGRQYGFIAMAVAAHQCGNDWLKEQQ